MKTLFFSLKVCLLGITSICLSSCSSTPAASTGEDFPEVSASSQFTNSDVNIATVQKFIDAQMRGDGDTMRLLASDRFTAVNPAGDTLSLDQYIAKWEGLSKTRTNQDAGVFATNSQNIIEGRLKGSWVLFWGTYTAVQSKNQRALEILWHADFMLENGKIIRSVSYFDMVDPDDSV